MCKYEEREKGERVVREWRKIKVRVNGIVMRRERMEKERKERKSKESEKWEESEEEKRKK